MMSPSRRSVAGPTVITALVSTVLAWQAMGTTVTAQDATLSVTVLIVNEKAACRPAGYRNYEDEATGSRQCDRLPPDDVDDLAIDYAGVQRIEIPPNAFQSGAYSRLWDHT